MPTTRPREVRSCHLDRKAVVYLRQSTDAQVVSNRGSAEYQRSQRRHAEHWGWPPGRVEVIEDDLGLTGSAAGHRAGYQRLVAEIERGLVGAVFLADDSRLGRDAVTLLQFLSLCLTHDVLLVLDGRVADLRDPMALFQTRLGALLSEHENLRRREHSRRGTEARVAAGKAVTAPPVGYVRTEKGEWELDPDPEVQSTLTALFQIFRKQRSCALTVRELCRRGLTLPRRPPGRPLRWVAPDTGTVLKILKNPRYTGCYVYRERVGDPRLGRDSRGQVRLRRAHADETISVENHHPPYVSLADWQEIQAILRGNAPLRERRNLGPGSALLQGIITCGRHERTMSVGYKPQRADGHRPHYYHCNGQYEAGGQQCGNTAGHLLDAAVVRAVLERLAPPRIAALRNAWAEIQGQLRDAHFARRRVLERARQRATDLERRYLEVDPANRLVARALEKRLEEATREVVALEGELAAEPRPHSLSDTDFATLLAFAEDLPGLFHAATTHHRDRKEILRTVVRRVVVVERSQEDLVVRVCWADGIDDTPVRVRTFRYARHAILRAAGRGEPVASIVRELNAEGLTTLRARPWTVEAAAAVLRAWRVGSGTRSRLDGSAARGTGKRACQGDDAQEH